MMATPNEQTLLVTGANSYVATHIISQALEKGYNIRGTVRSHGSAEKSLKQFEKYGSKLSMALVADITKPELYEAAFNGISAPITGIIHTASPFTHDVQDNARDMLDPAINGATAILEAAKAYGTHVQRVVSTSSIAALVDLTAGLRPGYVYTDKDWAPLTYEFAKTADSVVAYAASKALAEKAMWEFMEKEKPQFTLATINPGWIFGPHLNSPPPLNKLNMSTNTLWHMVDSDTIPPPDFLSEADVRDVGAAHVAALEQADAAGARFLMGSKFTYQDVVDVVRNKFPVLKDRLPVGEPGSGKKLETYTVDTSKVEKLLGRKLTSFDDTVVDTFAQLVAEL